MNTSRKLNNILNRVSIQTIRNNLDKYDGFVISPDNQLVYAPTNQIVVTPDRKQGILEDIYDEFGLGSGIKTFYSQVSRRYLGISRADVTAYLRSLQTYQIGKKKIKQLNRRQFATAPNKSWNIDLIDLNQYVSKNRGFRFII